MSNLFTQLCKIIVYNFITIIIMIIVICTFTINKIMPALAGKNISGKSIFLIVFKIKGKCIYYIFKYLGLWRKPNGVLNNGHH